MKRPWTPQLVALPDYSIKYDSPCLRVAVPQQRGLVMERTISTVFAASFIQRLMFPKKSTVLI